MLDLLITGGQIVDGTGSPGFFGTVAVEGDRVHILRGDLAGIQAKRTIDATGRVVSPGFIDMHAHSALVILAEPRHDPKIRQGVTTELIGVDGNSFAPFPSEKDLHDFVRVMSGLEGIPPLTQRWLTVAEYLSQFDRKVACNIAYVVGNSPLRISAMGWEDRRPTEKELGKMKDLLRQSMEEGAFGMSTGLDYAPGSYADTNELVELSKEVSNLGGIYHTHVRYGLGDRFLDPFREAIDIGRRSGVPIHITHYVQKVPNMGGAIKQLELVDSAREEGLDVTFDSYPHVHGSGRLLIVIPQWAQEGGPDALLEVLRSPEGRARLEKEVVPRSASWNDMWMTYFKQPHNQRWEGRTIADVVQASGKSVVDTLCDLLIEEELQVCNVGVNSDPSTISLFYQHPLSMVGSDAVLLGDYPAPRSYGCFPYILGRFVREDGFLSLPEAIRKMTSFPAQRLGLRERGILRDGFIADIVVFDPDTIESPATPQQPRQYPRGIDYVIVNGTIVVEGEVHTGALPGRALRRGHD